MLFIINVTTRAETKMIEFVMKRGFGEPFFYQASIFKTETS